ncbi:cryptochrome/photolyase family protein [Plebeiibacterium sediminum]|uniref:DNA photolyase family protein n=1 Tax=Plebeiibacterium sediminum TaxID=2992112 RepID=A0AAE3M8K8_9BACT|nr:deoxyribodipyrimidine photo-lyase [Plebeiobacterium sediminum]MCW3789083.1 DNA photolyase family protein [Plebeiobacterium sediminum]
MIENSQTVNVVWLRRDIRLEDNKAIEMASKDGNPILLVYIFDDGLVKNKSIYDPGLNFVYQQLKKLNETLGKQGSSVLITAGNPVTVFKGILQKFNVKAIFANKEYEPYTISRDRKVDELCTNNHVRFELFKDHVIFEPNEVLKVDGTPYQVFTSYKNKWLQQLDLTQLEAGSAASNFYQFKAEMPSLDDLGITACDFEVKDFTLDHINEFGSTRDFPGMDTGSFLGPHLRHGTISIRKIVLSVINTDPVFLSALIWREFFIQILYHFPYVIDGSFKKKYDFIKWENDEAKFKKWQEGKTGYPMVDAGMRELNATGYMHNRVRMVAASFLCKHLLIDWRWGEAYFASKLCDYEFAANNGNWQWVAGSGCDAAPYFRVFNPMTQHKKFDSKSEYVIKWVPEYGTLAYGQPIIDHDFARKRVLEAYKNAVK